MPLSRYLKIYADPDRAGHHLLFSTKKGSLVRVSPELLAAAESDTLTADDRATLQRLALWTADEAAERAAMAGLVAQTNARSRSFTATVVLTLDCNLACPYCFEDHFRGNFAMAETTAAQLVAFVQREQLDRGRDVHLRFYGGEPLLALPMLQRIAAPLQAAAATAGTTFSCSLVTNGTLLTRQVVEELLPLGLQAAQFTLDGPAEIHDRQRPFVSGSGSFSAILANLREIYRLVTIKLGGNFSRENYRDFPLMLDALLAAGIDPTRLDPIQFAPILPKSGPRTGHDGGCFATDEPWVADAALFLRAETLRRGFKVDKPAMGICMMELTDTLVVNYDGSLYKCPNLMGWPELAIGTLAEGIGDYRISHQLDLWRNDACLDCAYLPLCFGGCRLLPLLHHGAMAMDCRKAFYDATLEQFVRQDLHHRP